MTDDQFAALAKGQFEILRQVTEANTKIDGMLAIVAAAQAQVMPMITEISDNPAAFMRSLLIGKKTKP